MVYQFNPLEDPRWNRLLERHPRASAFHSVSWLESLRLTYGYDPIAYTTSPAASELSNAIVFCRLKSWICGTRLVSVPFADHCEPLFDETHDLHSVLDWVIRDSEARGIDGIEIRPLSNLNQMSAQQAHFQVEKEYRIHRLDLGSPATEILKLTDKDSVQRRLRHAARKALEYEEGNSAEILAKFYRLLLLTRRRHGLPPQPIAWFQNLVNTFGTNSLIRIVSIDSVPVAAVFTLTYKSTAIYKYGCSDTRYNHLGGMVVLFWKSIEHAKKNGATVFDMGRSDLDNPGLIRFKSNWGATASPLEYWFYPPAASRALGNWAKGRVAAGYFLSHLPDRILIALGSALYRHAG